MTITTFDANKINLKTQTQVKEFFFKNAIDNSKPLIAEINKDYKLLQIKKIKKTTAKIQPENPPIYVFGVTSPKIQKNSPVTKVPVYIPKTPPIKLDLPNTNVKNKRPSINQSPIQKSLPKAQI